jgi:hypothetical protein
MANAYHPAFEIGRIIVTDQLGQKSLREPVSMEKSWVWWRTPVIPVMVGSIK